MGTIIQILPLDPLGVFGFCSPPDDHTFKHIGTVFGAWACWMTLSDDCANPASWVVHDSTKSSNSLTRKIKASFASKGAIFTMIAASRCALISLTGALSLVLLGVILYLVLGRDHSKATTHESSNSSKVLPPKLKQDFIAANWLLPDAPLYVACAVDDNLITGKGNAVYDLSTIEWNVDREIRGGSFQAVADGKPVNDLPPPLQFSQGTDKDGKNIFLIRNGQGDIDFLQQGDLGNGLSFIPVDKEEAGVTGCRQAFAMVQTQDFDWETIQATFSLDDAEEISEEGDATAGAGPSVVTSPIFSLVYGNAAQKAPAGRGLQAIGYYIDIAIGYDSSFCTFAGGSHEAAWSKIEQVVGAANVHYEKYLKTTLRISYVDGYCDPSADKYTSVISKKTDTFLDDFRSIWTSDEQLSKAPGDIFHLFTGDFFSTEDKRVVGRAKLGAVCDSWRGFGINQIGFSNNLILQNILFAHELGHHCGARHDSSNKGYIMYPYLGKGTFGFSSQSQKSINQYLSRQVCLSSELPTPPCAAFNSRCSSTFDGVCNEPTDGDGTCPSQTDCFDCDKMMRFATSGCRACIEAGGHFCDHPEMSICSSPHIANQIGFGESCDYVSSCEHLPIETSTPTQNPTEGRIFLDLTSTPTNSPTRAPAKITTQRPTPFPSAPQVQSLLRMDTQLETGRGHPIIALEGNTLAVGAYADDDKGTNSGAVYVYSRSDPSQAWSLKQRIVPPEESFGYRFGEYVALNGNTLVVGATGNTWGAVYVFGRASEQADWVERQILRPTSTDEVFPSKFGSVALDGNTLAVGAFRSTVAGVAEVGSVYIFSRSDGQEDWLQKEIITARGSETNDWFGYDVALDGNTLVVESHGNGWKASKAYVFQRTSPASPFSRETQLNVPSMSKVGKNGIAASSGFVAVRAVGMTRAPNISAQVAQALASVVVIYRLIDDFWTLDTEIDVDNALDEQLYGAAVAMEGNKLVIGVFTRTPLMAHVYQLSNQSDTWTELTKLEAANFDASTHWGTSQTVAISSGTVAVGAYYSSGQDSGGRVIPAGSTYVHELN